MLPSSSAPYTGIRDLARCASNSWVSLFRKRHDATTPYHQRDDQAIPPEAQMLGVSQSGFIIWKMQPATTYQLHCLHNIHLLRPSLGSWGGGEQEVSPYICKQARNLNVNLPEDDWQPGKLSISIAQARARAQGFQQLSSKLSQ